MYQGRFKSCPVQEEDHFFTLRRCVERNALRAGLVARAEDWRWGSLYRWNRSSEPNPRSLCPWPIRRPPDWLDRVNTPLEDQELDQIRWSIRRGSPLGDAGWVEQIARRLNLKSTLRPRGRPRKKPPKPQKES